MLHELGHALGYQAHSNSTGDIMYFSSSGKNINGEYKLTGNDIDALIQMFDEYCGGV